MENTIDIQKTIIQGLQGLPEDRLREIAEYIFFIRQKALKPEAFQHQFEIAMMSEELDLLEQQEAKHLESEFNNYQELYPKE